MTGKQILIVEDEKPIRDMIAFGLRRAGFMVSEAEDCSEARASIADSRPDLLLVDWMLPDQSGLELTRSIKRNKETQDLPVILLTARAEEQDKIAGLEGGADDYVTKPFSPRELLARINAVLRRASPTAAGESIEAGALKLDPVSHRVIVGEKTVSLGPRSTACCSSSWNIRSACTRAASCSIASGAATSMWKNARWTSTSAGCARPWSRSHATRSCRPVRGSGYRFSTRPE
jgi:two-component system phosphate regulon response regulator PhoB